ncbi:meiotic nuclear division protein 1 [Thelephora terrestris]|uniref:Meiotic nuclear division protein 1 n=1 Tax=Thelephora terrestris TaxID=56493 RepID=A0A9P6LBS1_9AGAM|nr:meiotic nuclear division protein 1 [Thelephora terrestris]
MRTNFPSPKADHSRASSLQKDFFQLKELEKLGPKMKGIVSQSVKEVVQSLVDDGLVQFDKIGSSNFFWSFPSQQGALVQNRLNAVQETQHSLKEQLAELRTAIAAEKAGRSESAERASALEKLSGLKKDLADMEEELQAYGACDPVKIQEKKRAVVLAKEAAIRWTDNYSCLKSHVLASSQVTAQDLRTYLEIGDDYEDFC